MTTPFIDIFYPCDPNVLRGACCRVPFAVAAPSCVWPATLPDNCRLLAQVFPEIGLTFFETEACLAYGPDDLPGWLAGLGIRWHVHLPLDLPWERGPEAVCRAAVALADKAAFLKPHVYVLHPPADPADLAALAELWARSGLDPAALAVENVQGGDLVEFWPVVRGEGLGVCLDLGHVLAYGQESCLDLPGLETAVRLAHLSAPGLDASGALMDGHRSLDALDERGRAMARRILGLVPAGAPVVLEIFKPEGLCRSVLVLKDLCGGTLPG